MPGEDAPISPVSSSIAAMLFDSEKFNQLMAFAEMMAKGGVTVPKHLQGNIGDCMAITMQATQWGMNPFVVAQKTHIINGTLGYEAQLVNAVISTCGALEGRPEFVWDKEWEEYKGKTIPKNIEPNLGVTVIATLKGQTEPKKHRIVLSEAVVRNSPLWKTQPSLQLAYLAVKQFARLFVPDAILGVYTDDELGAVELPQNTVRRKTASIAEIGKQQEESKDHLSLSKFLEVLGKCETIEALDNVAEMGKKLAEKDREAGGNAFKQKRSELSQKSTPLPTFAEINDQIMTASTQEAVEVAYELSAHLDDEARKELRANADIQLKALS